VNVNSIHSVLLFPGLYQPPADRSARPDSAAAARRCRVILFVAT
jgi:hypothetical protein